jgi:hypothetical protein
MNAGTASAATVVLVVYEAGNFPMMLSAADCLRATSWTPILFSPYFLPQTSQYLDVARDKGFIYVHESTQLGGDADVRAQLVSGGFDALSEVAHPAIRKPSVFSSIRTRLARVLLGVEESELERWRGHYESRIRKAVHVLATAGARIVVLPEENVERDSAEWIRAIHLLGGRAAVLTYGAISPEEGAIAYFDHPDHRIDGTRSAGARLLFRRWCMRYRGRDLVRLPLARLAVMEELGLAPDDPWVVNTGLNDKLFVESQAMADTYRTKGVSRERISVVGTPLTDRLHQSVGEIAELKARLLGDSELRRVLLCAIPPDQYAGRPAPEYHSYPRLLEGWLQLLLDVSETYAVLISPHPSLTPHAVEILRSSPFKVIEGGVAGLIPLCDVYLASVSSTIKWAVSSGKPVVNYDCYGYDYEDLRSRADIRTVFSAADARFALNDITLQADNSVPPPSAARSSIEGFCIRFVKELKQLDAE